MKKTPIAYSKTYTAINTHLFLPVLGFIFFLYLSIFSAAEQSIGLAVGFGIATLLPIFVFLISPLYIVFSNKEVKIVYVLGQKEMIRWIDVRSITAFGGFSRSEPLPYYSFAYPKNKKTPFFVNGEIPKTLKTKKMIKKYYKGHLYD